jgi:hypothetical protein
MVEAGMERIVLAYAAAWNTEDELDRRELLEHAFAANGIYIDPGARVVGRDALVVHSRRYAERVPGSSIALTSGIDEHDGHACFTWRASGPDGTTIREGIDFVTAGPDGRLTEVRGFFGAYTSPHPRVESGDLSATDNDHGKSHHSA